MTPNVPIAFAAGIATGGLIAAATIFLAAPAKGDTSTVPYGIVLEYAGPVCAAIDNTPTFKGLLNVGQAIRDDGWGADQTAEILVLSILDVCPEHEPLLRRFVDALAPASTGQVV